MLPERLSGITDLAFTAAIMWLALCALVLAIIFGFSVYFYLAEKWEHHVTVRDRLHARRWNRERRLIAQLEQIPHEGEWLRWEEIA